MPDLVSLIIFLVIGLVAGWLAGQIMKGGSFGLLGNLIVGVIGAVLGGWLLDPFVHSIIPGPAIIGNIVVATLGAIILLFLIGLISKK